MAKARTNSEELSFEKNFNKLEQLSEELQENRITVDQLVPRVKEALAAFKVCKDVLRETEIQLTEIRREFDEIESDSDKA